MYVKLTPCAGCVLSAGTCALGRCEMSFSLGLWQRTHISIWLRFSPWIVSLVWQPLQLLIETTVRRGTIGEPSTEKLITLLVPPYSEFICLVVPGSRVIPRRPSIPML